MPRLGLGRHGCRLAGRWPQGRGGRPSEQWHRGRDPPWWRHRREGVLPPASPGVPVRAADGEPEADRVSTR